MMTNVWREEFLRGVRAEIPIVMGGIPFGMIYGAVAVDAMPMSLAQSMSLIIFGGSAQFIAAQLVAASAPALVLLTTTFIVNLRHLLYSASLVPYVNHLPLRWKLLLGYLLTDEAYAVAIMNYAEHDRAQATQTDTLGRHWYFLGAGLALWVSWQLSTALGILLGARIPPSWSLDFALALTFIGLVIPALRDRPHVGAAVSAGIVAVLTPTWPYKLGLMAAALVGIVVGVSLERLASRHAMTTDTELRP